MTSAEAYESQRKAIEKKFGTEAAQSANYGWGQAHNHIETKVYKCGTMKRTVIVVTKYKGTNSKKISHTYYNYRQAFPYPANQIPKARD